MAMPGTLDPAREGQKVPLTRPFLAPLGRWLATASSASADLYLGYSCADLLASGRIERHAPTVFRCGRILIVVRHDAGLTRLPDHDTLIYVMDDDWRGGVADGDLPFLYRARLLLQEGRAAIGLEVAASVIVASNPVLAWRMRNQTARARVVVMAPAWPEAAAPLPPANAPARTIAYFGAATHRTDLDRIVRLIDRTLAHHPEARFTFSANHRMPRHWRAHDRITAIPAMSWPDYRCWMADQRFDIGLYPLGGGLFNASRSINKLAEYNQFGAAVLGSDRWAAAAHLSRIGACQLVGDAADNWDAALSNLLTVPGAAHDLARTNRAVQAAAGLTRQRAQWDALLSGQVGSVPDKAVAHG
jgi:hypothetical protein